MKKVNRVYLLNLMAVLLAILTGCTSPNNENAFPPTETVEVLSIDTSTASPTETSETSLKPALAEQAYLPASGTFQILLPENWNCSESGHFQVNCESQSGDALLQTRISSTGYELTDESLFAFAHAELVHRYGSKKDYVENEKSEEAGSVLNRAAWREEGIYWEGTDQFIRQGRGVLHLTFAYHQDKSDKYATLFDLLSDSLTIYPERLTKDAFYPFRREVSARDDFFEIEVPTSWGRYIDATAVEKTIVEGYTSPDKRASVQIAIYKQGTFIEQEAKAFNTREIMFALYGFDLKNSDDRALQDGRERLTWYAKGKDIYGVTDFDTYVNALYLLTITWEPETEGLYLPVLKEIQVSFSRE